VIADYKQQSDRDQKLIEASPIHEADDAAVIWQESTATAELAK